MDQTWYILGDLHLPSSCDFVYPGSTLYQVSLLTYVLGTCKPCKSGLNQMCVNEAINGVTRDGGYGEYCTLRTEAAVRIPDGADPVQYCPLLCAGVTVFNSLRQQKITPGETVAISGS